MSKGAKRLYTIEMLLVVMLCQACCSTVDPLAKEPPEVRTALLELRTEYGFTSKPIEIQKRSTTGGGWVLTIWSLPKTPGGFTTVVISPKGQGTPTLPGNVIGRLACAIWCVRHPRF
jgi:hypothetical protein